MKERFTHRSPKWPQRMVVWVFSIGAAIAGGCAASKPASMDAGGGAVGGSSGTDAGPSGGDGGAVAGASGTGGAGRAGGVGGTGGGAVDAGPDNRDAAPGDARPDLTVDATTPPDGGAPPPFTGPTVAGTITVTRGTPTGRLGPGFAGFSFEKSHMSDGFFTGTNAPLIALFKLLGPGVLRIGANDVDRSIWQPGATFVAGGTTSNNVGTAEVDALADFLRATGWRAIYGVNMRTSTPAAAVAEATYVMTRLGDSLASLEVGNEINFFGAYATVRPQWETFATAIHAALPTLPLAAPATAGDINFSTMFARDEASQIVMITHHYYRGSATGGTASLANLLAADGLVTSQSQLLATAVSANRIRDGFRWGEMNSYSGHGAAGVSDVFGSALWGIDFMLTTAQLGSAGVNFHGGGQNMDGNTCSNGAASCTRPFRYSPILEVDSQVTAAAPLFYGMLVVAQAGVGAMLPTRVSAGNLNFTAYTIAPADGSTTVVLVNKDASNGVDATIDLGIAVGAAGASVTFLQAPALGATTGVTFAGAGVTPGGSWNPRAPYTVATRGTLATLIVPPASAAVVRVR